jgi:anti-sigma-K factor RskA
MTITDEMDDIAAEYVLGTLDGSERASVDSRRGREPDLDRAIAAWEVRLAPLNEFIPSIAPPTRIKASILARLTYASNVVSLEKRVSRWRSAALGATALAASLVGLVAYREVVRSAAPRSYVAVLQKDAASPAFLMTVDVDARTLTIRPVAAQQLAGKSYELWLVNEKLGAPKSLGVVGDRPFSVSPQLASYATSDIRDATYAVTLEPEGGSPSGAPTGPVLYAGKLVQANP